jgi:ectoine hydroxylase-related dioxygenase (phytanoyl-CoA dioxygenase family)
VSEPAKIHGYVGLVRREAGSELAHVLEEIHGQGFAVVRDVLAPAECDRLAERIDAALARELATFGEARLRELNELGQVRCPCAFDPAFLPLIEHPRVLEVLAATVGPTAILHVQNAIVTTPQDEHWQSRFHRDFAKDFVAEKVLSLNAFWVIDEFDATTGATFYVPFTHRDSTFPSDHYLRAHEVQLAAPRGSVVLFDSLLIHRAGTNRSGRPRRAINHQYTRPFVKQQVDIAHMMRGKVDAESKLAQLLGLWSVPPKSLEEFRVDPPLRTYRAGQG